MRTAVVRVNVDPAGEAVDGALRDCLHRLAELAEAVGMSLLAPDTVPPPDRREVQILVDGDSAAAMQEAVILLCTEVFGSVVKPGTTTFVSRGTDSDALGVLAGMGVTGEVEREPGDQGWDVVTVRVPRSELERVPESRIHTALEAALNCDVVILAV